MQQSDQCGPAREGPDFIGIGAQKAATTWLFKWLNAHPDAGFAPRGKQPGQTMMDGKPVSTWPKEIHFLTGPNQFRGWDWYLDLFDRAGRSEKVLGEICPRYLAAAPAEIAALCRHCPGVRLLLNLRDPVARDWSAIRMVAKRRGVLDQPAALIAIAGEEDILRKGDLRRNIAAWLEAFGREQFFICTLEGIETRPLEAIQGIAAFLGLDPGRYADPGLQARLQEPVHRGAEIKMPAELKEMLRFRHKETRRIFAEIQPDITA